MPTMQSQKIGIFTYYSLHDNTHFTSLRKKKNMSEHKCAPTYSFDFTALSGIANIRLYLAYATERVSRITVILTCPG